MLDTFFVGDFHRYFSETSREARLWLQVHVPKTAGSSLTADFARHLLPRANINVREIDGALSHAERFKVAVDRFIENDAIKTYRFASGHISGDEAQHIKASRPGVQIITMLREPIARCVSDYRYQRSEMHPEAAAFIAKYPDFASFVHRHPVRNKICRHLLPRALVKGDNPDLCARYLAANYGFVGMQEHYTLSLRTLGRLAGVKVEQRDRVRENALTPGTAVDLTGELEAVLRTNNALDLAVCEILKTRFDAVAGPLATYLDSAAVG